jgi:hypothetical protein
MFGKKKPIEVKNANYQCQIPGCGLNCSDAQSLKRHMDWAHKTNTVSGNPVKPI